MSAMRLRITELQALGVCVSLLLGMLRVSAVNNDGKTDIYWRNGTTNAAWTMNGVSYDSSITLTSLSDTNWMMVGSGDFNRDGQLDLLWRHATTGMNGIWFMSGSTFLSSTYLQPLSDTNWVIVATGYFDGPTDKAIDLLWRNQVTGDNAIWFMDGAQLLTSTLIQEVPDLGWKVGGTGDFNNDGHTDIVWRHSSTGLNGVWYMQGGAYITSGWLTSEYDSNWQIVGTGHFSGTNDSTIDLLWRYTSNGDNAIWQLNGLSIVSTHSITSAATGWKVGGTGDSKVDTDGDGLPDLWERNWFGNLANAGSSNPDGDSLTNTQEYQYGTDPTLAGVHPELQEGIDHYGFKWVCGGNGYWGVDGQSYEDTDSDRSGVISDNQTCYMETTIIGAGTFKYYYLCSSEESDVFRVYVNGSSIGDSSGEWSEWAENWFGLNAGTNTVRFEYIKNAWGSSGSDCVWVDNVTFDTSSPGSGPTLADALENANYTWQNGSIGWTVETNMSSAFGGGDSARNGSVSPAQESSFFATVTGPGVFTFYWKMSGGSLKFLVDSSVKAQIWNTTEWGFQSHYLSSGSHEVRWTYIGSLLGLNRSWVDYVRFEADSDIDGLPDSWETSTFGGTSQSGNGDYDADGINNLQEYLTGSNPTVAELRIRISAPITGSFLP
jgi:hypothetical protein